MEKMVKRTTFIIIAVIVLGLAGLWYHGHVDAPGNTPATTNADNTTQPAGFDKKQYSLTDPTSIWLVVNKLRPLNPKTYVPAQLVTPTVALRSNITTDEKYMRSDSASALEKMFAAAKQTGVNLNIQSGYRSYNFQISLYNGYVKQEGQAVADTQSARPGYSEHQTGLAVDVGTVRGVCEVNQCFGSTPEGRWVAANAYKYGFIVRYPDGKQSITGYEYEPWHIRYVGTALSEEMHQEGIATLEEFFGLSAAPDYN
jgi:D-alanyl-D-alanine carboxypeptidase